MEHASRWWLTLLKGIHGTCLECMNQSCIQPLCFILWRNPEYNLSKIERVYRPPPSPLPPVPPPPNPPPTKQTKQTTNPSRVYAVTNSGTAQTDYFSNVKAVSGRVWKVNDILHWSVTNVFLNLVVTRLHLCVHETRIWNTTPPTRVSPFHVNPFPPPSPPPPSQSVCLSIRLSLYFSLCFFMSTYSVSHSSIVILGRSYNRKKRFSSRLRFLSLA